jgi:polar amino acid transport system substrate-binding protein
MLKKILRSRRPDIRAPRGLRPRPGGSDKLVVGMELAYPPFETKDADGNPSGVSVDFAKAFGESIGREVEIQNIAWDGLIPALQTA